MFPITIIYAGVLGVLMAFLSIRVPLRRASQNIPWGDGGDEVLSTRMRVFGNFTEYVPIILVFMALLEASAASGLYLHGIGAALVVARIAHAVSLNSAQTQTWRRLGRAFGAFTTWLVLLASAGYLIFLSASA